MKINTILLLLFIQSICFCYGQNKNEDICVAINSKLYLYIGYANPINLSIAGIPKNQLKFKCSNGKIYNENILKIKPLKRGLIELEALLNGNLVAKMKFLAVDVPAPLVGIGEYKSGNIPAAVLAAAEKLNFIADDKNTTGAADGFPYEKLFRIVSFTVSTKTRDGYCIDKKSMSEKITSEQKALFRNIKVGQKIYFEEIVAESISGTRYNLGTLMYKVR